MYVQSTPIDNPDNKPPEQLADLSNPNIQYSRDLCGNQFITKYTPMYNEKKEDEPKEQKEVQKEKNDEEPHSRNELEDQIKNTSRKKKNKNYDNNFQGTQVKTPQTQWKEMRCPQNLSIIKLLILSWWWSFYGTYFITILFAMITLALMVGSVELIVYLCTWFGQYACRDMSLKNSFYYKILKCAKCFYNCNIEFFCCTCCQ